jgi:hypothetical protein
MEKKEGVKRLIKYLAIIIVTLVVVNILIGLFASFSYGGFPSSYQGWYFVYSILQPTINAIITGISVGFGIIIAHELVN